MIIRLKRGVESALPASAPSGEPYFCTDTKELYFGNGAGVGLIKAYSNTFTNRGFISSLIVAKNTSTQSIEVNDITKVLFTSESKDTLSEFSNSTFTSKSNQIVAVTSAISMPVNILEEFDLYIYIYKNGSLYDQQHVAGTKTLANVRITSLVPLEENDTLEVYCRHLGGTTPRNLDGNQILYISQCY